MLISLLFVLSNMIPIIVTSTSFIISLCIVVSFRFRASPFLFFCLGYSLQREYVSTSLHLWHDLILCDTTQVSSFFSQTLNAVCMYKTLPTPMVPSHRPRRSTRRFRFVLATVSQLVKKLKVRLRSNCKRGTTIASVCFVIFAALCFTSASLFMHPSFSNSADAIRLGTNSEIGIDSARIATVYTRTIANETKADVHGVRTATLYEDESLRTRVDRLVGDGRSSKDALIQVYSLPPVIVEMMTHSVATRLYWKLVYVDIIRTLNNMNTVETLEGRSNLELRATVLFIHVQNGLGNRLRALASGIALARATCRVPVLIWQPDPHLNASVHQLLQIDASGSDFNTILYKDIIAMDRFIPWSLVPIRHSHFKPFNYMGKDGRGANPDTVMHFAPLTDLLALKEAPDTLSSSVPLQVVLQHSPLTTFSPHSFYSTVITHDQHVYFKSAYVAKVRPRELVTERSISQELRHLVPALAVTEIVSKLNATRLRHSYGIHIRSRTIVNDNVAVNSHCEYSLIGSWTTDYWRSFSQLPIFVAKIHEKLRVHKNATFFVATDDIDIIAKLKNLFPNNIDAIDRNCDNRHARCVIYAFADLISLSKTKRFYGSKWSSFSEVVGRLSSQKIFLSGRDFGRHHKSKSFLTIINRLSIFGSRLWFKIKHPFLRCH